MNKLFYAALAAVPAICVTSCSDPTESAAADVEALVYEVKACIEENKDAKDEEFIAALHECVVPKLESITAAVEDMDSDAKFEFLRKYHLEENETMESLVEAVSEELQRRFKMPDVMLDVQVVWKELPKESKVQVVGIGEAFFKLSVTLMGDGEVLKQYQAYQEEMREEMRKRREAEFRERGYNY